MKYANTIFGLGEALLVLGSALYVLELLPYELNVALTPIITVIYAVALVLMLIGWIGTREERKIKKQMKKQQKAAKKAAA